MPEHIRIMMRLHNMIKSRRRGSKQDYLNYLGIGKRTFENMRLNLISMGADLVYNAPARRYEYQNNFEFFIGVSDRSS